MRFTRPTKTRLPKEARSIPYKPRGDEKLWECWNCGFICDEDRDDHSGLTAGDNHTVNHIPAFGGNGVDGMIISTEVGTECVLMKQTAPGDNEGDSTILTAGTTSVLMEQDENDIIYHVYASDITKGCPFCGSTNYKG